MSGLREHSTGNHADRPVDPTGTTAWSRLTALARDWQPDLRTWFDEDPDRVWEVPLSAYMRVPK